MQMLCSRGKDQFDGQSQHIARKNSGHHFRVAAHMPDAKRTALRRLSRQANRLAQTHAIDAVGHARAAKTQTPLLRLQGHQRIYGGRHAGVTLFEVENNDLRIWAEHGVGGIHVGLSLQAFNAPLPESVHRA